MMTNLINDEYGSMTGIKKIRNWVCRAGTRPVWVASMVMVVTFSAMGQGVSQEKPNVLMIAIDDLNDWVGFLKGHPQVKTPNMDALAASGVAFTNAHCQSPLCNPSRTSLLLGKRPSSTGIYGLAPYFGNVDGLKESVPLMKHFRDNGYRVMSTGKIFHGGYPPKADKAKFADAWGPNAGVGARPEKKSIVTPGGNHPLMDWGTFPHKDEDKGDWKVASWAVGQLEEEKGKEDPFFLSVGFFLPHVPCYATQKWFDLYPDEGLIMPPVLAGDRDDTPRFSWYIHWKLPEPRMRYMIEAHQWRKLVRAYLACVSFVDDQVGRVLKALEDSGKKDNTIIVLWSDHGYHIGEKEITGKNTLWRESTRVPLLFSGPGIVAKGECSQPAELLDIYPTLIDLCGLSGQSGLEGHTLIPQLRDVTTKRPWPAITTHNHDNHSIRSERYRYIRYADGSEEFYDCETDPREWNNLAGMRQFRNLIEEHRLWLPDVNAAPAPGSRHRILIYKDGVANWQGEDIDPNEPVPDI